MTLLRDRIKDAILSLENDEKDWSDFTITQVAQVVHDQVAVQMQNEIQSLQAGADPAMAQSIQALTSQIATLQAEADATKDELAKHEADTTDATNITTLQQQMDDTQGALNDFFDALKANSDPNAALAALAAATGNEPVTVPAITTGTDGNASTAGAGDAAAQNAVAAASTTGQGA